MENEFFKTKSDIEAWLKQYKVCAYNPAHHYTLVEDATYGYIVNVEGTVVFEKKDSESLSFIPVKFGHVSGNFYCTDNNLTSLEFCPHTVGGNFDCSENELTSLQFCPSTVVGNFDCSHNKLKSLQFCPQNLSRAFSCSSNYLTSLEFGPSGEIGLFQCVNNKLTSLKFGPQKVNGSFDCSANKLTSLEFCPTIVERDFVCSNNKISTLQFCPQSVGGYFFGEKNPVLGKNHTIISFKTIFALHKEELIKKEKESIESMLSKIPASTQALTAIRKI